jgi:hypothetical protein
MNRLTRTLVASVLVTVMGLGTGLGVLAQSSPTEDTDTVDVYLQVNKANNTLWVWATAGQFTDVEAGNSATGALNLKVEDDRPADQTDWYVSVWMTEFSTADGLNAFRPTNSGAMGWDATANAGTVLPNAAVEIGNPNLVWWNTGTKAPTATANGTLFVQVPENTVPGLYSSTITVTITGTDPIA